MKQSNDKVGYYTAEIGSDERSTNLSYERAAEGFRYEGALPKGEYKDPDTGQVYETERNQLRAEETEIDAEELS